jgi:hypothetical protein
VRGEAQSAVGEWLSFANKLEGQLLNETVERQVTEAPQSEMQFENTN